MARYIFITGGVVSSLGKGLASAVLGALLQARGYKVRLRKLDPYLNLDPGTMSPYQHGEVFVTDDGAETDLDLGHYERFTGRPATKQDNITTGRIYQDILTRERRAGIPLIGDPDDETISRVKAFYNAIAVLIEKECKLLAVPLVHLTHEGFGRALITVGKLLAVDRTLRDVHRFGFPSLSKMKDEADKILSVALERIGQYPAVAGL